MRIPLTAGIGWAEWGHEEHEALDLSLGGLGGKTFDLPLHFAGGGQEVCVWGRGAGGFPDVHADDGEFQRLQGAFLLRDVESLPCPARGAAYA